MSDRDRIVALAKRYGLFCSHTAPHPVWEFGPTVRQALLEYAERGGQIVREAKR